MFEKIFLAIVLTISIAFLYKFRKKEFDYKDFRYYSLFFLTIIAVVATVFKIVKWILIDYTDL